MNTLVFGPGIAERTEARMWGDRRCCSGGTPGPRWRRRAPMTPINYEFLRPEEMQVRRTSHVDPQEMGDSPSRGR